MTKLNMTDAEIITALERDGSVRVTSVTRMTTNDWEQEDIRLSGIMNMRVESSGSTFEATLTLHRNSR